MPGNGKEIFAILDTLCAFCTEIGILFCFLCSLACLFYNFIFTQMLSQSCCLADNYSQPEQFPSEGTVSSLPPTVFEAQYVFIFRLSG